MRNLVVTALSALALGYAGYAQLNAKASPAPHAAVHWSYSDQGGWGHTCATGHTQSPIALPTETNEDLPDLVPHYAVSLGRLFNNGHTLEFAAAEGSTLSIGAEVFRLRQFHVHTPSEHTLHGAHFPAEIHFVHRSAAGVVAVVGVFVREGRENSALATILAAAPTDHGEDHAATLNFDPALLWPAGRAYYAYFGSLTTPPCDEGVRWQMLAEPIEASRTQIAALTAAMGANARDLQQLNGRRVRFGR